ncbi:hypothetical protein [Phenylobacterium sp.]|uniref:hypothetical protein n=1 Tax=Phenylobacterium sp. TaxID=1871053 RepID=UPI0025F3A958|nr:hypothetical protein [Phenylobacterium sp.]
MRSTFSRSLHHAYGEYDPQEKPRSYEQQRPSWADAWQAWNTDAALDVAVFQLMVGLFGVAGVGYTVHYARLAWKTAEETLRETRDSSERQLRAYVYISKAVYRSDQDGERVELVFHNHGQTPAYDLWIERAGSVRDLPLTEALSVPVRYESRFDLAPNAEAGRMSIHFAEWDDPSPQRFGHGGTALYIHGALHYRDAFGKSRQTDFRYLVRSRTDHGVSPCEEGNSST